MYSNNYGVRDIGPWNESAFYKWFMKSLSEGKFDKDYVSPWCLVRDRSIKND
jgi:hypothetical protein